MTERRAATVTVHAIAPEDTEEILAFELANRAYFTRSIPDRPDDYFERENLEAVVREAVADFRRGTRYLHLIRAAGGELVGRVNLFGVQRDPEHSAELGYRLAESQTGKGYASAAVGLVAAAAFADYGLHRLTATTSARNVASQIVLVRNGFQFWGRARSSFLVNGRWHDTLHFEKLEGDEQPGG